MGAPTDAAMLRLKIELVPCAFMVPGRTEKRATAGRPYSRLDRAD